MYGSDPFRHVMPSSFHDMDPPNSSLFSFSPFLLLFPHAVVSNRKSSYFPSLPRQHSPRACSDAWVTAKTRLVCSNTPFPSHHYQQPRHAQKEPAKFGAFSDGRFCLNPGPTFLVQSEILHALTSSISYNHQTLPKLPTSKPRFVWSCPYIDVAAM